jgi:hypothetical protein
MKQGTKIHKAREDEVHRTVPVDVATREDKWGLRIWNVIQGLRTLKDTGRTRELEIWGIIGGEIVNGIVDELSYDCPDPKLESQIDERYANAQKAKDALPEYQTTIRITCTRRPVEASETFRRLAIRRHRPRVSKPCLLHTSQESRRNRFFTLPISRHVQFRLCQLEPAYDPQSCNSIFIITWWRI